MIFRPHAYQQTLHQQDLRDCKAGTFSGYGIRKDGYDTDSCPDFEI